MQQHGFMYPGRQQHYSDLMRCATHIQIHGTRALSPCSTVELAAHGCSYLNMAVCGALVWLHPICFHTYVLWSLGLHNVDFFSPKFWGIWFGDFDLAVRAKEVKGISFVVLAALKKHHSVKQTTYLGESCSEEKSSPWVPCLFCNTYSIYGKTLWKV